MTDDDIAAILLRSRANNQRDELTGVLLYHQGRFIQVLEGPDDTVRQRFATITGDSRHRNVQSMSEKAIARRQFPEWTMGFRPMSTSTAQQLNGFNDFFGRSGKDRLEQADNGAQQFLEWLAEYWFPKT